MLKSKKAFATLLSVGALGVGVAAPAQAAPVITGGLVNVTVTDVANQNTVTVQLPIGVAANVCNVSVLTIRNAGGACTATSSALADAPGGSGRDRR